MNSASSIKPKLGLSDVDISYIPDELKKLCQWNIWKLIRRNGKTTKTPLSIHTGKPHNVQDTNHLGSLEMALSAADRFRAHGIGFSFVKGCGFVGIDLDDCIDKDGVLSSEVAELIDGLGYCEVSPSGSGIKVFVLADVDFVGRNRLADFPAPGIEIEMYNWGRYFTVTSARMDRLSGELVDQTERVQEIHQKICERVSNPKQVERRPVDRVACLGDQEILEAAFRSKKGVDIATLYRGDWSGRYESQSQADLALCNYLAFYAGSDPSAVDRLFRSSGLYRNKWDRVHVHGKTYGQATIDSAIANTNETYTAPRSQQDDDQAAGPTQVDNEPEEWGEVKLTELESVLPEFPLEIFPLWCRRYLQELTRVLQVPPDFAGMLFLGVLALCWQKRRQLEVNCIWKEPLVLWVILVASSGSRKSPAFSQVFAPLVSWSRYMKEEFKEVRKRAKRRLQELEAELEQLRKKKAAIDLIREKEEEIDEIVVPPVPRIYTGTATPEAIEEKLAEHYGRYGFASAESDILAVLMGKYSRGGGPPPIEGLLSGWTGEALKADYRSRDDVDVEEAHFTQVICTQPGNAAEIFNNRKLTGRGALGRYLPALPYCEISEDWITERIPSQVSDEYLNGVRRMLPNFQELIDVYTDGKWTCKPLVLSDDAAKGMEALYKRTQRRRKVGGDLQFLEEWSPKFCGQVARIAALLHLCDHAFGDAPEEVSESAMERAAFLGEKYLIPHAKAAFGSPVTDQAEKVWSVLKDFLKDEIPRKELIRAVRPLRSQELQEALDILEEQNLLRVITKPSLTSKRPPSFVVLNPNAPEVLGTFGSFGTYSLKLEAKPFEADSKNGTYSELNRNFIPRADSQEEDPNKFRLNSKKGVDPEASVYGDSGISSINSKSSKEFETAPDDGEDLEAIDLDSLI